MSVRPPISFPQYDPSEVQAIPGELGFFAGNDGMMYVIDDDGASSVGTTTAWVNAQISDAISALTKSSVGLGNVDNTSDANKPVSTAQQTALNLKANIASPTFTGTPSAPTATAGTNTTQIATTAFVGSAITALTKSSVGLGNVDNTSDANKPVSTAQQTALDLKANLASPAFSGTPTAPTAAAATNTTQIATTKFVNDWWGASASKTKLDGIATGATANSTDATLLARANHTGTQAISTIVNLQSVLDAKASIASPTFTGTPSAPTATAGTNTTQIATTAFVAAGLATVPAKVASTDNAIVRFDGTAGNQQNSGVIVNDANVIIGTGFQLGSGGPQLKAASGFVSVRNSDDSAPASILANNYAGYGVTVEYGITLQPPGDVPRWIAYNITTGSDRSWYFRDVANARTHMALTPGATQGEAVTLISSRLTTGRVNSYDGNITEATGACGTFECTLKSSVAGVQRCITLSPTYQQTGEASSCDLRIGRTETSLGSGAHYFVNFLQGATSRFSVTNTGVMTAASGAFAGSVSVGAYTFATVPSASANTGATIRISDRSHRLATSDGTNWNWAGTTTAIS